MLLNAVVYRDYVNPTDIQIKIFDDQITFFSPGKFFGGLSIADIATDHYPSRLRNKLIAEAFYLTRNIEKYGSGFIRIRKELESYPTIKFNVEEIGGGKLVSLKQTANEVGGVNELIAFIKENPGVRTSELTKIYATPQRTIERWLKQLKDQKIIIFKGAPKTGGYYPVDKEK